MGLTYEPLGKYVRLVDERNTDIVTESVLGINIDKYFMPSVANVIGTDLSNYKLLRKGRFACNPMHVGRDGRLPVSRYTEDSPAIVSPAYFMFEIKDENEIEPEYLMLCFRRPDFDRMCWFRTDASVRGGISWEDVCALTIPVPPISEQRKIVHDYQVITHRIKLLRKMNEKLEEQIMAVYHQMFDGVCRDGTVAELGDVVGGATPSTENAEYYCSDGIVWLSPKDLTGTGFKFIFKGETDITEEGYNSCSTKMLPKGSVLLTSRAPVGMVAIAMKELCTNQGFKSIVPKAPYWTPYIYCLLKDSRQLLEANASGTTFLEISGDTLKKLVVPIPEEKLVENFSRICEPIFKQQMLFEKELTQLNSLVSIRVSSIAKGV